MDANRYFPESVEVVPHYSLPSKDRHATPVVLDHFPVVDKGVIFTHGLAALQELLIRYETQVQELQRLKQVQQTHLALFV